MFSQKNIDFTENAVLIGEIKNFSCHHNGTLYFFNYDNKNVKNAEESRMFNLFEKEFDHLYSVIERGFNNVPVGPMNVETSCDILVLNYQKTQNVVYLQMLHMIGKNISTVGSTRWMSKKEVAKLFGKKE